MDELDALRRLRADLPGPDPDRALKARAVLCAVMNREARAEDHVRRPARRVLRWRWAFTGAVAAAAVALAVAIPAILPGGSGGAQPAAAAALRRAAAVAARQPSHAAPAEDQYVYTKSEGAYLVLGGDRTPWAALLPRVREAWIGPDGSGRLVETAGKPRFLSDEDRAAWRAAGSPNIGGGGLTDESYGPYGDASGLPGSQFDSPDSGGGGSTDEFYGPGAVHFLDLSSLPTDPDALRRLIEDREVVDGPPGDWETFTIVGDLLRETYAPPALRAALYQVAAGLPGVALVEEVTDAAGRHGVAVAHAHDGQRHELIFDPDTSALLGERYILVDPRATGLRAAPGTVIGYVVYLISGIVDSANSRP